MADECVVCGEAVEGKPLYKKLGDGELNVEVMTALRALQITTLPESAKNSKYICWDCDEVVLAEYGRHLEAAAQEKAVKQSKKQPKPKPKKKKPKMKMTMRQEGFWVVQQVNPPPPPREKKQKSHQHPQQQSGKSVGPGRSIKASNAHHSSHCLMCDGSFESESRGFLRHPLKKTVNDEMDVAQVMEVLGLARHIEASMKARRFVCNPCYIIIRRNYKDKLLKSTSTEDSAAAPLTPHQDPIHRATTEEHAAEIAKLLPPDLVECYKILTGNPGPKPDQSQPKTLDHNDATRLSTTLPRGPNNHLMPGVLGNKLKLTQDKKKISKARRTPKNKTPVGGGGNAKSLAMSSSTLEDSDVEEEDKNLNLSQDEHGNYFIDVLSPSDGDNDKKLTAVEEDVQPALHTPRKKKKNVLLPKRLHHHLSGKGSECQVSPVATHGEETESGTPGRERVKESPVQNQENLDNGTCNICGICFTGKTPDWWHTLSSQLMGFDSITINMALKVLETQLADTSEAVRAAQQVCLPCYSMVSGGFRSQMVQRFARQKNLSASQIDLSRVKVRMLPKDALGLPGNNQAGGKETPSNAKKIMNGNIYYPTQDEKDDDLVKEEDLTGQKRKLSDEDDSSVKKIRLLDNGYGRMKEPSVSGVKMHPILRKELQRHKYKNHARGMVRGRRVRNGNVRLTTTGLILGKKKKGRPLKIRVPERMSASGLILGKRKRGRPRKIRAPELHVLSRKRGRPRKNECLVYGQSLHEKKPQEVTSKPVVVLKDLKFVLPREAFGGKAVSALKIEDNMTHQHPTDLSQLSASNTTTTSTSTTDRHHSETFFNSVFEPGANASPLQFVFNALSTYHPPDVNVCGDLQPSQIMVPKGDAQHGVCERCVVCGYTLMMQQRFWYSLEDNIRPPTLMVPVQWVCVSLSVSPANVPDKEKESDKVCQQCFNNLGEKFQKFIKTKVGESCGLDMEEVDLSEYLITFNPNTMNIEADPKQQSYIHEFEDGGELLLRILPLVQQFSMEQLVMQGPRQPLQPNQYCVWLLLVLNELRMQVGAALGDLGHWLVSLMPSQMYQSGLRPCPTALAAFLLKITHAHTAMSEEELCSPIPSIVFVVEALEEMADPTPSSSLWEPTSEDLTKEGAPTEDELDESEDLPWEEYLQHINLDNLMSGSAKPIAAQHLTQGLVYAIWQVSRLLAEGDQLVVDWIKQLAPVPLTDSQVQNLVTAVGTLQGHLETYPDDVQQLKYEVLPLMKDATPQPCTKFYTSKLANETQNVQAGSHPAVDTLSKVERKAEKLRGEDEWKPGKHMVRGSKRKYWELRRGRRSVEMQESPNSLHFESQENGTLPSTLIPSTTVTPTSLFIPATTTTTISTEMHNPTTTTQLKVNSPTTISTTDATTSSIITLTKSPAISTTNLTAFSYSPITLSTATTTTTLTAVCCSPFTTTTSAPTTTSTSATTTTATTTIPAHSSTSTNLATAPDNSITATNCTLKPALNLTCTSQTVTQSLEPPHSLSEKATHISQDTQRNLVTPHCVGTEIFSEKALHTDIKPDPSTEINILVTEYEKAQDKTTKSDITPLSFVKNEVQSQGNAIKGNLHDEPVIESNFNGDENNDSQFKTKPASLNSKQQNPNKIPRVEEVEQLARNLEEKRKEDLAYVDYERESEAMQVSTKLLSKCKELESKLEEIKRHNHKLLEANNKLAGISSPKTILHNQEQQTNDTLNHIKDQLKSIMQTAEIVQGATKAANHSPLSTSPCSQHSTTPKKHQDTKSSKHSEKLHKKAKRHRHSTEKSTKSPGISEAYRTLDKVKESSQNPSSSLSKTKRKDETDTVLAKKRKELPISAEEQTIVQDPLLIEPSKTSFVKSKTKEVNLNPEKIKHSEKGTGKSELLMNKGKISVVVSEDQTEAQAQIKPSSKQAKFPVEKPSSIPRTSASKTTLVPVPSHRNRSPWKHQDTPEKKTKLSFEAMMNYDVKVRTSK